MDSPLYAKLAAWRLERARDEEVPAYIVFHNRVLAAIAEAKPSSRTELGEIPGVGPTKLDRYGDDVLVVLSTFAA
jgi:superfamily II DNA helicase RecQ